ncbi:DUF6221 family protein [Arthrobacter agilis]|uniref:DUF6221 family protein n=1 Tax=Arthrobacter agilis TaxID=37921 RepID=UPI0027831632|nr:DUF6221 family protein [Arthrobacter agilis]MDQ0736128.1 hypothetical protein [Arthrobacter agilis]
MNDIAAFLDARITEDENAARRGSLPEEVWGVGGWYDPQRVLAECRGKRELLRYAVAELGASQRSDVLRLLALPWTGHVDYRATWHARADTGMKDELTA